jgi:hypothetical protein
VWPSIDFQLYKYLKILHLKNNLLPFHLRRKQVCGLDLAIGELASGVSLLRCGSEVISGSQSSK